MAGSGSEFKKLLKDVIRLQFRYPGIEDQKRCCFASALTLFNNRGIVLDVGYEEGYEETYRLLGFDPVGFNLPDDMHEGFEGKWERIMCRHVLEHSVCPALVLRQLRKACIGECLVIVPQLNDFMVNHVGHFTVLHKDGWKRLFDLAGFQVAYEGEAQWAAHHAYKEWQFKLV